MNLERGKYYVDRNGRVVQINTERMIGGSREGELQLARFSVGGTRLFLPSGRLYSNRDSEWDLVAERPEPYTGWMCQVGEQAPMPSPNEEIARKWAEKSQGRTFQVIEVLE